MILALAALALARPADARRLPIRIYTTADGLASNALHKIVRDSHGFLWFCTLEGLSRFDGRQFTNYGPRDGLPGDAISDLIEARTGDYWLATSNGLCRFRPGATGKNRFEAFYPGADPLARRAKSLLEDADGSIWVGTQRGLFRFDPGTGTFAAADLGAEARGAYSDIGALLRDRRGELWIAAGGGLYRRRPGGGFERFATEHGLPTCVTIRLLEDRQGRFWVGSEGGLSRLIPNPGAEAPGARRKIVERLYGRGDLPGDYIQSILEARDGSLWVATLSGVGQILPGGESIHHYTEANGLSDANIEALAEDRDGNVWLGSYDGGGAMRIARNGFVLYGEPDGLKIPSIAAMIESRAGELCAIGKTADQFLFQCLDSESFRSMAPFMPRPVPYGRGFQQIVIEDSHGEWWVATGDGLVRYPKVRTVKDLARARPKAIYQASFRRKGSHVYRLYEDSRGDVWISVSSRDPSHGLVRWDRKSDSFVRYSERDGLPPMNVALPSAFAEDRDGALWIAAYWSGVVRYREGRFEAFGSKDGAPEGWIRSIHRDHAGRMWLVSDRSGVARVDDPKATPPRFRYYTRAEGLASDVVYSIAEDRMGRIYVGTGSGVDRIDPDTGRIIHYTPEDGLPPGVIQAAYCDRQGVMWFGSQRGLARFAPEPDRPREAPAVQIRALRAGGAGHPVSGIGVGEVSGIVLRPDARQLEVEFGGLEFGADGELRYQHRLGGAERDWSEPRHERSVRYASLSPGKYRFEVRAVNVDGQTSARPAAVEFEVLAPVWRRWWFVTLAAFALAALAHRAHRFRVARAVELERVRSRIATDLHDDIGSSLSQIAILSDVARERLNGGDPLVMLPLAQIGKVSREVVDSMSDIVWSVNPKYDRVADLAARMRRFAGELLAPRDIAFRLEVAGAASGEHLDADTRRQIYLIFKESIHNVARHSSSTEVAAVLETGGDELRLAVRDNGKGFDPEYPAEGNGLRNMRQRAERLGGWVTVTSGERGTAVELRVPVGAPKKTTT